MTGIESTKTVTTTQAAAIIGVSRATVVRFCDERRLPYAQPGKHRILRLADVLAFKADAAHGREDSATENTAAGRLAALIDRIPDSSHVTVTKDDLRTVLAEHAEMGEQLTAFLDGAIPPYRPVSIPDMTDGDRIRALRNLLNTSIRLARRRLARTLELRTDNERLREQLQRLTDPTPAQVRGIEAQMDAEEAAYWKAAADAERRKRDGAKGAVGEAAP